MDLAPAGPLTAEQRASIVGDRYGAGGAGTRILNTSPDSTVGSFE
jgi:hypothetical protein